MPRGLGLKDTFVLYAQGWKYVGSFKAGKFSSCGNLMKRPTLSSK